MGLLISSDGMKHHQGLDRMVANSGKIRCPALTSAEGQSRAKQAWFTLGVCREHVQPPEGKMCSELHGNMQRSPEMSDPASQEAGNRFAIRSTYIGVHILVVTWSRWTPTVFRLTRMLAAQYTKAAGHASSKAKARGLDMNVGEFGEYPMPDLVQMRKGNPEPSKRCKALGVCREHVPTTEVKMCSELYGNVERLPEMCSPVLWTSNNTDGPVSRLGG